MMYAVLAAAALISCTGKNTEKPDSETDKDSVAAIPQSGEMYMLVGTYTSEAGSKGIYVYKLNTDTGKTDSISMAEVVNPSYLVLSPDEKFVYSVGENGEGNSAAHAFSFDKTSGTLNLLNSKNTDGSGPCYIEIDRTGKNVLTANYGGGSISVFQVLDDGSLTDLKWLFQFKGTGADTVRQNASHVHCVRYSPDGKYLFATDLGTDKLYKYQVTGTVFEGQPILSAAGDVAVPPATGPRHFEFHPNGKYMYLLGELSGQVIVYDYNAGELTQKQIIVADTVGGHGSADIHVSPDGRFLYASNRLKADGIAVFSINPDNGTLTKVGYQLTGRHPRNFIITPNGNFLLVASRDDNKIQVFAIDSQTGLLTDTQQDIPISKPVCIKFAGM